MGWFQTLFVYLHAMPRATLRRIWDWWLSSGDFEVRAFVGEGTGVGGEGYAAGTATAPAFFL